MQSLVETDLAGRLESANRYIAELEIAKATAATQLSQLSADNKRLLDLTEDRAKERHSGLSRG